MYKRQVLETIEKEYIEEIDQAEVMDSAINGVLQSLDPYSAYMSPEVYKEMQTDTRGEFGGLGIEVGMEAGVVKVISPIEDSPAYEAGVKAGDYIIKIDDEQVQGKSLMEAVKLMRGKIGTPIEITIRRKGLKKAKVIKIDLDERRLGLSISEVVSKPTTSIKKEEENDSEITAKEKNDSESHNPNEVIEKYGADALRLFVMFVAPPEQSFEWSDKGLQGAYRYLNRLWNIVISHVESQPPQEQNFQNSSDDVNKLRQKTHKTLSKVKDDYERRHAFNTAVAAIMELTNYIPKNYLSDKASISERSAADEAIKNILIMLSPIAPHITQELWSMAVSYTHLTLPTNREV